VKRRAAPGAIKVAANAEDLLATST
jgi:hypothetical protein